MWAGLNALFSLHGKLEMDVQEAEGFLTHLENL